MAKFINNTSGNVKTYAGQSVPTGGYYQIPVPLEIDFAEDDLLITDLATAGSGIVMSDDGLVDLSGGPSDQINFLKGVLTPRIGSSITQIVDDQGNNVEVLQGPQGDPGAAGPSGFGVYAFSKTSANGTILKARGLSVTKAGTGSYDYTFTTPTPDADYAVQGTIFNLPTNTDTNVFVNNPTVNGFNITIGQGDNGTALDTLMDEIHSIVVLGNAGPQGITSAYESWLDIGNVGTEADFIASLVGPTGATGPQGPQGPPGDSAIRISPNDTTTGFIEDKFVAGSSKIAITVLNEGGDEDLSFDVVPENINTNDLNNDANFINSAGAPVQPGDIANFETSAQLDTRDTDNRSRSNHTGTQLASTISDFASAVTSNETTTSLSFNAGTNILSFTDEDGLITNIDLSLYLDDTNLSRIVSGVLNAGTGICTFTRDDLTTFDVDFSSLNDQSFINAAIATHETTIANHDDVVLTDNATDALLKFDGSNFVPFIDYKVFASFNTPIGTQSDTFQQALRLNYDIPQAGNYKLSVSYIWSVNTTGSNFEAQVEINDTDLFCEHAAEPQDAGGGGVIVNAIEGGTFNSGTDQRLGYAYADVINLPVGAGFIDLDIANQVANTEATFYRASLILERFS